jgi:hypothetical protein
MTLNVPSRNLVVIVLLIAGLLAVYGPQLTPILQGQSQRGMGEQTYVADLDFWQRTEREATVNTSVHFDLDHSFTDIPLTFGDWSGEHVPDSNQEVLILLDPEQYEQRLYYNSRGEHMWLTLIGGRSSQPFHAPDICYDADGWQYNLSSAAVDLDYGGQIHGLWMEARKQFPGNDKLTEQMVYYFYLFPNGARTLDDGIVLVKLTSGRYGDTDETLAVHADFLRNLFTSAQPGVH